jgi:hypothetical protein
VRKHLAATRVLLCRNCFRGGAGGSVKIAFQGTKLISGAWGEAKVEGKKISLEIDAKFQDWKTLPSSVWNI